MVHYTRIFAHSSQLFGLFQPVGGRECPVLQRRVSESGWWRQGMSLPAAPLVRILLSLAVNVGLFSAVCTYLACFSPSAGLFQPLSAQFSVRCRRFSRFSVKFRCFASTTAGCRVRPCYPGWVIQVACVSFASFTAGSTLASAARLLYTCGLP